jgi:hypothetical protein
MHEFEESNSAIVATKPANKAEQSLAEPMEQRAGTKGNADQQSTRRAQDRASVSQALERIRQAARQRKKERLESDFDRVGRTCRVRARSHSRPHQRRPGARSGERRQPLDDFEARIMSAVHLIRVDVARNIFYRLDVPDLFSGFAVVKVFGLNRNARADFFGLGYSFRLDGLF